MTYSEVFHLQRIALRVVVSISQTIKVVLLMLSSDHFQFLIRGNTELFGKYRFECALKHPNAIVMHVYFLCYMCGCVQ